MKNYEKYTNEIREKIRKNEGEHFCSEFIRPYILKSDTCGDMTCNACHMLQTIWLLEEYEEPETDWSKVEVDTPILVRQGEDGEWLRRHFAKYENGIIYTWKDSRTSWTEERMNCWNCAKLAES